MTGLCSCLVEVKLGKMLDLVAKHIVIGRLPNLKDDFSFWTVAESYRWSALLDAKFGEGCHLQYIPSGFSALGQMGNMGPGARIPALQMALLQLCNQINTLEGCKFGDKCHFTYSDMELGNPGSPGYKDPIAMRPPMGSYDGRVKPSPDRLVAAADFGANFFCDFGMDGWY
ncbi:hypothetical protein POM88_000635 [Heracleum sosnowskyi]|uniref:Uncharacterized protein n=1 Tax=Heracleum sosnowskyi TaxID=360622 RepID=A0AAD8JAQ2_9APIA|nr:hypothetical protein POM88_000635 [Heracleum sosnowskyi]